MGWMRSIAGREEAKLCGRRAEVLRSPDIEHKENIMALDGLTLGFLAREINEQLAGGRVDRITQPDNDLLIIHLRNRGRSHRLLLCATPGYTRVHLSEKNYENPAQAPMFCMLARKHLQGGRFLGAEQLFSDRLLLLRFSNLDELGEPRDIRMYFEAMGKHSNLSLVLNGTILDSLRHVTLEMSRVRQMLPGLPYVMPPRQDKLGLDEATDKAVGQRLSGAEGPLHRFLFHHIAGLGAHSARELAHRLTGDAETLLGSLDRAALVSDLAALLAQLPELAAPCLFVEMDGTPREALPFAYLSLPPDLQRPQTSLSSAVETLYFERDLRNRFNQRSAGLRRAILQARERALRKLALLEEDILTCEQAEELRIKGELITASMHLVPRGAREVSLPDYYTGGRTLIALEEALSPAQNAQRYFKLYRKAHTARKLAGEQKQKAMEDIRALEEALYYLEDAATAQEISQIRAGLADGGLLRRQGCHKAQRKETPARPLRFLSEEGYLIQVGRNSRQNEQLLKTARGEDLWLHAKDIPGSHVLISARGSDIPQGTLLLAARLAAFYSQTRGQQVQVDYTQRRLVKKIPGGAPGQVYYTGEKSMLVSMTPEEAGTVQRA
jgi:predicted ribosome quality control (RQC) complex YloA/Tae2 family protein